MAYRLLDVVVLEKDLPAHSLRRGDLGVVVEMYDPDGLEVEFVTAAGRTEALVTLTHQDVRGVLHNDLVTVRSFTRSAQLRSPPGVFRLSAAWATTLYRLGDHIEPVSLNLIFLGGVLYHLSDMLVGLLALRHLLKPGRLLISDLCEFMGFERPQIRFYTTGRCLARAVCPASATVPFKRGLNWAFAEIRDAVPRSTSSEHLAPRPLDPPR